MPKRWNYLLFVVLLLGQLLLLAATEPTRDSRLERWLLQVQAPVVHAGASVAGGVLGGLEGVRLNRTLREQNESLRDELATAQGELLRLQNVEDELLRLSRAVDYTRRDAGTFFVAEVVYVDQASTLRTLVLYTGTERPKRNQAVRTPLGLVGRVIVPAGRYAKVQLITDRASSVSAMVERTRRKGMVRGTSGGGLELALLPRQADVREGDSVVTAGIDGVYPRGIPIGTVRAVVPTEGLFLSIELDPAIDLGLLEQVYVLTAEPVPADIIGEGDVRP